MWTGHDVQGRCRNVLVLLVVVGLAAPMPSLHAAPRNFGAAASAGMPYEPQCAVPRGHAIAPARFATQSPAVRSFGAADGPPPTIAPTAQRQPPQPPEGRAAPRANAPQSALDAAPSSSQVVLASHVAGPAGSGSSSYYGPAYAPYVAARLPWYAPSVRIWAYRWPNWFYAWRYGAFAPWAYGPWAYRYVPYRLGGYSPWIAGGWGYGSSLVVGPYYRVYGPWEVPGVGLGCAVPGDFVPAPGPCGCLPGCVRCPCGRVGDGEERPPPDAASPGCRGSGAAETMPNPPPATDGAGSSAPAVGTTCYFW